MYGKKFKDINLIKKKPIKFKRSGFELFGIFNEDYYSFIIILSKKKQKLKMPLKKFYFLTEKEIKEKSKLIFYGKDYLSTDFNQKYYVFFERKIDLKKIKVLKNNNKIKKLKIKNVIKNKKKKYWGYVKNIFNQNNSCAKEIYMMKNTQSSMEFHIKKEESYFIYEGELDIGLRYARAKQKITKLKKNNVFKMLPGTMHMRMAKKNTTILEMSNNDDDTDSIIVHDGKKYNFKTTK